MVEFSSNFILDHKMWNNILSFSLFFFLFKNDELVKSSNIRTNLSYAFDLSYFHPAPLPYSSDEVIEI